jgi:hypothetical protein
MGFLQRGILKKGVSIQKGFVKLAYQMEAMPWPVNLNLTDFSPPMP